MKIAIVGSAASTRDQAPFDNLEWSIWALAWRRAGLKRVDMRFEMHDPSLWSRYAGPIPAYLDWLRASDAPVVMRGQFDEIPNCMPYPFDNVETFLGEGVCYTSSVSYMLALAIYSEPEEIGLFGIDMLADEEYAYQRPAAEYLIGLARGRGIKVTIPGACSLTKANFMYGEPFQGDGAFAKATGITPDFLEQRLQGYLSDRAATQARINAEISRMQTLDGAIQEAQALLDFVKHFNRGGVVPTCES